MSFRVAMCSHSSNAERDARFGAAKAGILGSE
jgi:hypothetical protein